MKPEKRFWENNKRSKKDRYVADRTLASLNSKSRVPISIDDRRSAIASKIKNRARDRSKNTTANRVAVLEQLNAAVPNDLTATSINIAIVGDVIALNAMAGS